MKITIERDDLTVITYETSDNHELDEMIGVFDDLLHALSYHYDGYLALKDYRKDLI